MERIQRFANKYEKAAALAKQFPAIEPWVPTKPKLWQSEPRNCILFEALSLAKEIIDPAIVDQSRMLSDN
ncbi:hypothetical protein [Bauldia sp.]|uniref:hypothetical protein n=1 Tax=Bauldia sp. TaxID=2575872 RepID=UPI003BA94902